jgi:hypothetical protein
MKILFGNHHLEERAGSELFTAELARSFRARGNDVAIFTFFKGELAAQIEAQGIPVFDPDDRGAISGFLPDIVQTCHLTCAHFLRAIVPDAILIHAMLGVIPLLEAPPLDAGAFSLGLAVSEEVIDRINQTPFGRDVDVAIFRNWFDDSEAAVPPMPRRIQRVAVVSNHIASELVDALAALQTAGDFDVDYFGVQRKSVVVDGLLLVQYDLIVSIGRTVLMAAACGVPCIVADIHGSDGLLTIDNLDDIRTKNFSGRYLRHAITKTHLQQEIEKIGSYDRKKLRNRVAVEYSLSSRVEWLALRYGALLADQRGDERKRLPKGPAFLAPSEGLVYAEMTSEVRRLRERLAVAQCEIDATARNTIHLNSAPPNPAERIIERLVRSAITRTNALGRLLRKSVRFPSD